MENKKLNILFIGDMVGKPGRKIVADYLSEHGKDVDFVIANAENASHGFGLTNKNYNELINSGIQALTSGNHIWDKKDVFSYIKDAECLIRPLNYPKGTLGVGHRIFEIKDGVKIAVINLLGRTFMPPIDSPFESLASVIKKIKKITPIIIVDFHAEATAEKLSFGYYANSLGVSAVLGTHTHIQTADERILKGKTAYITDVGFSGVVESVIGMNVDISVNRMLTGINERFDVAEGKELQMNAVQFSVDYSGNAFDIKRINYVKDFS